MSDSCERTWNGFETDLERTYNGPALNASLPSRSP